MTTYNPRIFFCTLTLFIHFHYNLLHDCWNTCLLYLPTPSFSSLLMPFSFLPGTGYMHAWMNKYEYNNNNIIKKTDNNSKKTRELPEGCRKIKYITKYFFTSPLFFNDNKMSKIFFTSLCPLSLFSYDSVLFFFL